MKVSNRGRKSEKIKAVKSTERDALKTLWRTGVATKAQINKHFGLKGERLMKFQKSGFLNITNDIVRLNKKGIEYCEKELGMKFRYTSAVNHLAHDLKLTQAYLGLDTITRDTWRTENEIQASVKMRKDFEGFKQGLIDKHPNGQYKATPDAAILDPRTNEYVGFECVTKNYKDIDVQQKEAFCNHYFSGIIRF